MSVLLSTWVTMSMSESWVSVGRGSCSPSVSPHALPPVMVGSLFRVSPSPTQEAWGPVLVGVCILL